MTFRQKVVDHSVVPRVPFPRRFGPMLAMWCVGGIVLVVSAAGQEAGTREPAATRAKTNERAAADPLTATAAVEPKSIRPGAPTLVVVIGAAGTSEYGVMFREWARRWETLAERGGAECVVIGGGETGASNESRPSGKTSASSAKEETPAESKTDREQLREAIAFWGNKSVGEGEVRGRLWLILLGHGTFDGKAARFNLRGPDFSSSELAEWLRPFGGPVAIVDCSSSSGPFLAELSAADRIVLTATKAGAERNFARLGDYLSAALLDPTADLDKDEQVSLWEAYVVGAARLRGYYEQAGRLTTEHPLLDDNGDRQGTPAEWFQGLKPLKGAKDAKKLDGDLARAAVLVPGTRDAALTAEQRLRREALEQRIVQLRERKGMLEEAEYLRQLEALLVPLARLERGLPAEVKGQ